MTKEGLSPQEMLQKVRENYEMIRGSLREIFESTTINDPSLGPIIKVLSCLAEATFLSERFYEGLNGVWRNGALLEEARMFILLKFLCGRGLLTPDLWVGAVDQFFDEYRSRLGAMGEHLEGQKAALYSLEIVSEVAPAVASENG